MCQHCERKNQNKREEITTAADVLEADANRRGETFKPTKTVPRYYWSSEYGV